jgi:hypothetical protein
VAVCPVPAPQISFFRGVAARREITLYNRDDKEATACLIQDYLFSAAGVKRMRMINLPGFEWKNASDRI